jgi:thiol:disulfide interchange protein DsbD
MSLSGNPADFFVAFLGGVAMSFTPCVYPLIPVSVGYIGASASGSKIKGLFLSLSYVTGMALTYSLLGLAAVLTGTIFGRISSHPLAYLAAGLLIILFGLSMLDVFTLSLPIFKAPALKQKNYLGAFLLGLGSGLLVSPCLTPALGAILTYLATKKNLFYGALLLFSFAYGLGLIVILAGTFSGLLAGLPKSGKWMIYVKKACALVLIFAGVYFIFIAIRRIP